MARELLDDDLRLRVNAVRFKAYRQKVRELTNNDHQDFTRDLMDAFTEGRVTITLKPEQQQLFGEVYVTGK